MNLPMAAVVMEEAFTLTGESELLPPFETPVNTAGVTRLPEGTITR